MRGRIVLALGSVVAALFVGTNILDIQTLISDILPPGADTSRPITSNVNDPDAPNAQVVCPGYIASNVLRSSHGLTADLSLAGPACNIYGTDVEALTLTVEYQATDRLHVEITPTYVDSSNSSWFGLPETLIPKPTIDDETRSIVYHDLEFMWNNDPTFSFTISRRDTDEILFDTTEKKLVFENQFIEFASSLPENYNLYGLGEAMHGLRLGNDLTRTLYSADTGGPIDKNIYGVHPFYLETRYYQPDTTTGDVVYAKNPTDPAGEYVAYSHGVYFRNSHGQDVLLRPSNITWRALGGDIDLYFYSGPTQEKVTKAYQSSAVGLPAMQQYWTFGYHQSRWGYTSWSELQGVVESFSRFKIPLETIWSDIDYMNQYRNFETAQTYGYKDGAKFLSKLHENGQHWVPIVDSAIYIPNPENASDAYPTFDRGNEKDSFMLNPDGSLYIGAVWPGYTVFPDWIGSVLNGTGAIEWWKDEISAWYQKVAFDGIWIDMNEVSSFCVGSCGSGELTSNPIHTPFQLPGEENSVIYDYPDGFEITNATEASAVAVASAAQETRKSATLALASKTTTTPYNRTMPTPGVRSIEYPPYAINHVQGALDVHAVSPNATHHGGTQEYDYHNLFGHQILDATYHALLSIFPAKRPFIIGRSTFAGSGKYAGHWGGDNKSNWPDMLFSISQALSFSLFGIPMFGVDVCGFGGNSDEELCNRWMQLGAFFPFYRNHNVISANSQEPYVWASVAEASRVAMNIRYTLLPYIYTTFFLSHYTGSTTMRALAWEFPNEPLLASADRQFLLGSSLMITPVLTQGATTVDGVFPGTETGEIWYDWYNQSAISVAPGENKTIDAPLGYIPVYIRGGSIIPIQEPGLTTKECRENPWGLIAAVDAQGSAKGKLYIDDGEALTLDNTLFIEFTLADSRLQATPRGPYKESHPLANVTILGVKSAVTHVTFKGLRATKDEWSYDKRRQVLDIKGLASETTEGAWTEEWVLEWS